MALALLGGSARAQEGGRDAATGAPAVELGIGLRTVTSVNGYATYSMTRPVVAPSETAAIFDFSDTLFYVRPRMALFNPGLRVGGTFALAFPDAYAQPGTIFVAEANAFIEHQYFTVRIGRTRVRTALVPFPTLRDDDLIRYTDAQNPFSDGRSTADHQYGNAFEATVWLTPRWFVDAHADNMPNFVLQADSLGSFGLNSFGFDAGYQQIPALVRTSVLRSAGIGMNYYHIGEGARAYSWEALAGAWLNLVVDPIHSVDLRAQVIYNDGVTRMAMTTLNDTFRARQISAAAAVGYEYRRRLLPTARAAVTAAYKHYLDSGAKQYAVVANGFYSLGLGVELGLQYVYRSRAEAVPEAFGDRFEHALQAALIVRFDVLFNRQFDERNSILNTESGYLP